MEQLKIRGELLHVDVRGELEAFDWQRATWKGDKLIACSPFRPDNSPSFFVRLESAHGYEAGVWGDSGAHEGSHAKGGFVSLLAYIRRESWDETEDYLLEKYGTQRARTTELKPPQLSRKRNYKKFNAAAAIHAATSSYLLKRGIGEQVQAAARTGKPLLLGTTGFVALPWYNTQGELCNIKYRSTTGKQFFYEKDGQPISELVFGIDLYLTYTGVLVLCEAEIDALSWREAGIAAIAVGSSTISKVQADLISRLPCSQLIIAGDNDAAGGKLLQQSTKLKSLNMGNIDYAGIKEKDANDILVTYGAGRLRLLAETAKKKHLFVSRK